MTITHISAERSASCHMFGIMSHQDPLSETASDGVHYRLVGLLALAGSGQHQRRSLFPEACWKITKSKRGAPLSILLAPYIVHAASNQTIRTRKLDYRYHSRTPFDLLITSATRYAPFASKCIVRWWGLVCAITPRGKPFPNSFGDRQSM